LQVFAYYLANNPKLEALCLSNNAITEAGVQGLLAAFADGNKNLREFYLEGIDLSGEMQDALDAFAAKRGGFIVLWRRFPPMFSDAQLMSA